MAEDLPPLQSPPPAGGGGRQPPVNPSIQPSIQPSMSAADPSIPISMEYDAVEEEDELEEEEKEASEEETTSDYGTSDFTFSEEEDADPSRVPPSMEEEEEEEADPSIHPSMSSADPSIPLSMGHGAVVAHPSVLAPWLFYQTRSEPGVISAMNCLSTPGSTPEVLRFPLPAELQGYTVISSTGPSLLLGKRGSISRICLFNPFSSSPSFKRFFPSPHTIATLPPSPSLIPPYTPPPHTPLGLAYDLYHIHTLVIDPDSRIALSLMARRCCCIAYTKLPNPGNRWINLTHLIPDYISFQSAVLYKKGLFCAVNLSGNKVIAFDFSHASPQPSLSNLTLDLPSYRRRLPRTKSSGWRCYQSATLITSRSSLYLVRWRTYTSPSRRPPLGKRGRNTDGVSKRREMDIYVLRDVPNVVKAWAPVQTLVDCSFFIGHTNQSFSMSTADFPELQPNRVYISNDPATYIAGAYDDCDIDDPLGDHLVYDVLTKRWSVFYDGRLPCRSVWMMPAARRDAELDSCK